MLWEVILDKTGTEAKPLKRRRAALFDTSEIRDHDPAWYASVKKDLLRRMGDGLITGLQFNQAYDALNKVCLGSLNCTLEEASLQEASVWERVSKNILETLPRDLDLLITEFDRVPGLTEEVKKKCLSLLAQLKQVQDEASKDTIKAWLYVMRDSEGDVPEERQDSEGNGVFHPEWFHVAFFLAWTQQMFPKVLIMAPPRHGKTTCLRWYLADRMGRFPHRRFLGLYDMDDKPPKEGPLLQRIIESGRYRALFPEMRILGRPQRQERSSKRFTVNRKNWESREPTFEGYAIRSNFQGSGYDELACDDMCPPQVRFEEFMRTDVNRRFEQVAQERLANPKTLRINMIATPWHDDDAHGRIRRKVQNGELEGWLVLIDCFAIKDDAQGKAIPLWPSRFGVNYLQQKKAVLAKGYNCNYRLMSSTVQERTLSRLWFYNAEPDGELTTDKERAVLEVLARSERWLSIDPTATANRMSSLNGVLEFRWTPEDYLYVPEVWFLALGAVAMQDWLIRRLYHADPKYTGVHIEAQGAMKGQVSLWVSHIEEALRTGQIPVGEGEERQVVAMEPYKGMPLFVQTGTKMAGSMNNLSKFARFAEGAPLVENRWVLFAGRKVRVRTAANAPRGAEYRVLALPSTEMPRYEQIMLRFDGTTESDAVDATTQFILSNRHRIRNPNIGVFTPRPQRPGDPLLEMRRRQYEGVRAELERRSAKDEGGAEMSFYSHAM